MPDSVPNPGDKGFHLEVGRQEVSRVLRVVRLRRSFNALLAAFVLLGLSRVSAQTPPAPAPRFVVVLDAAHGGAETGGQLDDPTNQPQPEKNFTLALSVRLRSLLAARGIYVVTTRETDVAVDADRRAEIANRANAQVCLTLHASQSGTGVHIYSSSLAPAVPTAMLPWKTAQAAWITRSLALAGVLNSSLAQAGLNVALGRTDLPAINSMACPALAIEIGKQNSQDKSPSGFEDTNYQAHIAQALAAAVLEWKSNASRASSASTEAARP